MFCFRQLRCTRVTIHVHLFLSYVLTGVMWITYYGTTSFNPDALVENPVSIQIYIQKQVIHSNTYKQCL